MIVMMRRALLFKLADFFPPMLKIRTYREALNAIKGVAAFLEDKGHNSCCH